MRSNQIALYNVGQDTENYIRYVTFGIDSKERKGQQKFKAFSGNLRNRIGPTKLTNKNDLIMLIIYR